MIGQEHITKTLLESVRSNRFVHAYLLTGPRGIGKTSTARLLAKAINCEEVAKAKEAGTKTSGEPCNKCESCKDINNGVAIDVLEIDAASHTGVDNIRELIEKSRLLPSKLKYKVYIIDEVHMLSKGAFNALLKTLEEPPSHAVFILATTETQKIPATILSRVQRYDFKRASKQEIVENLKRTAKAEKIKIDSESLDLIATLASGAHRDALSLFEQVSSAHQDISIDLTRKILGVAEDEVLYEFVGAIFSANPEEGLKIAHELHDGGADLAEFNRGVIEKIRQILVYQISQESLAGSLTKENIAKISEFAKQIDQRKLMSALQVFIEIAPMFRDAVNVQLPLEMGVIKATATAERGGLNVEGNEQSASSKVQVVSSKDAAPIKVSNEEPAGEIVSGNVVEQVDSTTQAVPVVCMTKDLWQQVIDLTKKENATLAALLRDAKPDQVEDNVLNVCVKFKFHKDRISEAKHAETLSKIVSKVLGNDCRIVCKIDDKKSKVSESEPLANIQEAAAEIFEVE